MRSYPGFNRLNKISKRESKIGQPSLLYTGLVKVDTEQPYFILELTGHGGHAETYVRVGDGLGRSMIKLLEKKPIVYKPLERAVGSRKVLIRSYW